MPNQTNTQTPILEFAERFVVNEVGERVEVILPITVFEQLLAELRELRDKENLHREFDAWDAASDQALIEFEKALP